MKNNKSLEDYIFTAALLIFFICPFIYISGLYEYVTLPQAAFIQLSFLLLAAAYMLIILIYKKEMQIKKTNLNGAVLAFFLWTCLSSYYAFNHYESISQGLHWMVCILVFFLLQQLLTSFPKVISFLTVLYIAGALTASIGISQHLFQIDFIPQSVPPAATFANKNMAAQFITLIFPLGMIFLDSTRKIDKWIMFCGNTIMSVYLIFTQTRAAWLAVFFELVLAGIVLIIFLKRTEKKIWNKKKRIVFCTVLFLLGIFVSLNPNNFQKHFKETVNRAISILEVFREKRNVSEIRSSDARLAIWKNTIQMIKEKPLLGYGLGNHKVFYPKFQATKAKDNLFNETHQLSHVHNDFLQLLSETGIVGAIIVICLFYFFFARVTYAMISCQDKMFFAVTSVGVATAGLLVNSCFSFPFNMPVPPLVIAGYLACVPEMSGQYKRKCIFCSRKTLTVLFVFLISSFLFLFLYYYRDIRCDKKIYQIKLLEKKQKWHAVIDNGNKAYALNSNRKKILTYVAGGYLKTGEFEKGMNALKVVVQDYPYHMNALLNLGVICMELNKVDDALKYYHRALEIKPDFSKALINLAGIYMARKEYTKAVNAFKKAEVGKFGNPNALYNLGISQFYLGNYKDAALTLQKTINLKPAMVNAQLNLAILYYQYLEQPDKSIPHFKKVLALQPGIANADEIKNILHKISIEKKEFF